MKEAVIELFSPWLGVTFSTPHTYLGWPVVGASWGRMRRIVWLQVRDGDLAPSVSPEAYFTRQAQRHRVSHDVGMMTAADIADYGLHKDASGRGFALVTAGLGKGESTIPPADPLAQGKVPCAHQCGLHTALGRTLATLTHVSTFAACQTWLSRQEEGA